jgi:hypothetical protein
MESITYRVPVSTHLPTRPPAHPPTRTAQSLHRRLRRRGPMRLEEEEGHRVVMPGVESLRPLHGAGHVAAAQDHAHPAVRSCNERRQGEMRRLHDFCTDWQGPKWLLHERVTVYVCVLYLRVGWSRGRRCSRPSAVRARRAPWFIGGCWGGNDAVASVTIFVHGSS